MGDIKTDRGEIGWGGLDWINLAQDMHQWRNPVNTFESYKMLENFEMIDWRLLRGLTM
jgi:hypothetical protein